MSYSFLVPEPLAAAYNLPFSSGEDLVYAHIFVVEADESTKFITSISEKCSGLKERLKEVMSQNQIGLESLVSFEADAKAIPFSNFLKKSLDSFKIHTFTNIILSSGLNGKRHYFIFSFYLFGFFFLFIRVPVQQQNFRHFKSFKAVPTTNQ